MTKIHANVLAALVVVAAGFLTSNVATAKSCVMAGGEATMVTPDLARFMANAALNNSMKDKGLKPVGTVAMKCNDPSPLTYCIAKQRACK